MQDQQYMRRCLELALKGIGAVSPNPMVGCVIVLDNKIIGEGYHQKFGAAHAEVNAVNNVIENYGTDSTKMLQNATVYVNLEPCAHHGKTPPCSALLIKHKVKKVVIGNTDPFSEVNGKGIAQLKAAGIDVVGGVLQEECSFINRRFFTSVLKHRPYIILKWAQTNNGFFAPADGTQKWITGAEARNLVHKWRAEEAAVMVGKNTALADDPALTVRFGEGKNPIRILIDRRLETPETAKLFNGEATTLVFNEVESKVVGNVKFLSVEDMNFYLPEKLMYQLYLLDIQSVIIEGGANLLSKFIASGLWDEARVFTAPTNWETGLSAPTLNILASETQSIGADTLTFFYNKK